MSDLADFLLARIAEDEARATAAFAGGRWSYPGSDSVAGWTLYDEHWTIANLVTYRHETYDYDRLAGPHPRYVDADANGAHIAAWDPGRVLADCEAKRGIVEGYQDLVGSDRYEQEQSLWWACAHLAQPYADHRDFQESWRA